MNTEQQRLVDAYTEIAKLAGALAHEIKNPLSTIRLNMDLLAEELTDTDNPRDRRALTKVTTVQRECQRLQDLLEAFLRFTRPRELNFQPCDLNDQVNRLFDFFRPQAQECGIELIAYLAGDLPPVRVDQEHLHGVLLNLVLNAQQAMPEGGQIIARTRRTEAGVAVDLIDTGCGIPVETSERIFEAFFSTKRGGSGLGLPTARKVVEAHGGTIRVQSELNRGTQFTIELPAAPPDETTVTERPSAPSAPPDTGPAARADESRGPADS